MWAGAKDATGASLVEYTRRNWNSARGEIDAEAGVWQGYGKKGQER